MKKMLRTAVAVLVASAAAMPALAQSSPESAEIERQLQRYERALNSADTDAVMKLYASDAIFMPQNSAPAIGHAPVRAAYDSLFKTLKPELKFQIDEVQVLSPTWAFARTRSTGTMKLLNNGIVVPGANQEMFVFRKEKSGEWLVARYIFNEPTPRAN